MRKCFWTGILFGKIYKRREIVSENFLYRVDSKFVAFFEASGTSQNLIDQKLYSVSILT